MLIFRALDILLDELCRRIFFVINIDSIFDKHITYCINAKI